MELLGLCREILQKRFDCPESWWAAGDFSILDSACCRYATEIAVIMASQVVASFIANTRVLSNHGM